MLRSVHSGANIGCRVCVGSLWRNSGSSGSLGFAWVHSDVPSGHLVYSSSRGLIRFIRVRVGSHERA